MSANHPGRVIPIHLRVATVRPSRPVSAELPHRPQVDAPVPPADHESGEALPVEQAPCRPGLQERADRHARPEKPGR